jgi:hypothetical protein
MKVLLVFLLGVFSIISYSQDTILQVDTTQKVLLINPLPVSMYNILKNNGSGVEVTMYNTSKTFTLPGLKGSNYFLSFLQGQATIDFNPKNTAYVMLLVDDDFYMDAEVSIVDDYGYIIFKKEQAKYYNLLTPEGIIFFRKFMLPVPSYGSDSLEN